MISIHALLAESDGSLAEVAKYATISIHALLAESDPRQQQTGSHEPGISIHALLAESDVLPQGTNRHAENFYPRSPCGERRHHNRCGSFGSHFYPRSPCGERHKAEYVEE